MEHKIVLYDVHGNHTDDGHLIYTYCIDNYITLYDDFAKSVGCRQEYIQKYDFGGYGYIGSNVIFWFKSEQHYLAFKLKCN